MRFKSLLAISLASTLLFSSFSSFALTTIFNNKTSENIQYFSLPNGIQTEPVRAFRNRMLPNNLSERLQGVQGDVMFNINGAWYSCGLVKFHHALTAIAINGLFPNFSCTIVSR